MRLPTEVEPFTRVREQMREEIGSRLLLQDNVFHDSRASELVRQFNDCLPNHEHIYRMDCGSVLRCIHCGKGFAG